MKKTLLFCLMLVLGIFVSFDSQKLPVEVIQEESIEEPTIPYTTQVFQLIKQMNIAHPEIVFVQAQLESGHFTSDLFLETNNMFGMMKPSQRPTLAIGKTPSGFAIYRSWEDSVIDYALYQAYCAKNLTKKEYIAHLGKHYAEDPFYATKIERGLASLL